MLGKAFCKNHWLCNEFPCFNCWNLSWWMLNFSSCSFRSWVALSQVRLQVSNSRRCPINSCSISAERKNNSVSLKLFVSQQIINSFNNVVLIVVKRDSDHCSHAMIFDYKYAFSGVALIIKQRTFIAKCFSKVLKSTQAFE